MAFFNEFPNTRTYDKDLGWLIHVVGELQIEVQTFIENNTINIPDQITWDITKQYTRNTLVIDYDGTAYLSKQPVPVGIAITNTDYWMPIFNYDDSINTLRANIATNERNHTTASAEHHAGDLVWLGNALYKVTADMPAGTAYIVGTNVELYTIEDYLLFLKGAIAAEAQARQGADTTLQDNIDAETLARQGADTTLQDNIDAEALARQSADSAITAFKNAIVAGATGDGTTNDEAALQAILDAGYNIYLPTGSYVVSKAFLANLPRISGPGFLRLVSGADHVDLPTVHVSGTLQLDVPKFFASANDAIASYLRYLSVAETATVTIKYADGTYSGNQLHADHASLGYLSIVGNNAAPQNCRIELTEFPSWAFGIFNSNVGLISGFYVIGNGRTEGPGGIIDARWSNTEHQNGVFCWDNGNVVCKSMICDSCYYPFTAGNASHIRLRSDENYLAGHPEVISLANVSNYYGKYCIALRGGDCGIFVYNGSSAECDGAIALATSDASQGLGHGIISEHGSGIKCYGCSFNYNQVSGATSSDGSGLSFLNHGHLCNNGVQGFCARFSSGGEVFQCACRDNATGVQALDTSTVTCGAVTCSGNQNGFISEDHANIWFQGACTSADTYHTMINYAGIGGVRGLNLLSGTSPNGYRAVSARGNVPSSGYHLAGDYVIFNGPDSDGYTGAMCSADGNPGTWKRFGLIEQPTPPTP